MKKILLTMAALIGSMVVCSPVYAGLWDSMATSNFPTK